MKKRVVLMGKGQLAVRAAQWLFEHPACDLVAVVPNVPPSNWTVNLQDWAAGKGVLACLSGRVEDVPPGPIDLAISITYERIIQRSFIDRCRRIINIHNGPLPRYRGVNPVNWALKNGETSHGVTIHEITEGIDTGPTIAMVDFPINPEVDEVIDVYERCLHFGWKLFKETIDKLDTIKPRVQDEQFAQYYHKRDFAALEERRFFTRAESSPA